jgi:anti-sigma-K factor RskA
MIDLPLQEQASLHVLGALSPAEAAEFKAAMKLDPELQSFVAHLSTATGAVAGSVPAVAPPASLRAKILAKIPSP